MSRRVVYMFYIEEQLAESPCGTYHSLFYVEPAFAILQGIGINGGADHVFSVFSLHNVSSTTL